MTDAAPSLLIFHQGALGDVAAVFSALAALKRRHSRLELVCGGETGRLAVHLKLADAAHPMDAARISSLYTDAPAQTATSLVRRFDRVLLVSTSRDLESGVRKLFPGRTDRFPPRPEPGLAVHIRDHFTSRLVEAGLLEPEAASDPACNSFFENPNGRTEIILHPGSGSRRKNRPLSFFRSIAEIAIDGGWSPVLLFGPADRKIHRQWECAPVPGVSTALPSSIVDLADRLEAAAGFVGNDSGPAHLAAYLGIPTLTLFGPSDPVRWRSTGRFAKSLRPDGISCEPCFETLPENCRETPDCLTGISPDQAFAELVGLMESAGVKREEGVREFP